MFVFHLERSWHGCALVLIAVSLLVLPGLGAFGFWDPFELDVLEHALNDTDSHDSLILWSIQRAIELGGISERWARLPLALSGVTSTLLCFTWIVRASTIRIAVVTSLLFASSVLFLLQSRQLVSLMPGVTAHLLVIVGASELIYPKRLGILAGLGVVTLGCLLGYATAGTILGVAVPLFSLAAASAAVRRWRASLLLALSVIIVVVAGLFDMLTLPGPWRDMPRTASWDVMLEQVVFGAFPWIVLAPAPLLFAASEDTRKGFAEQVALAWVATSLLVTSMHSLQVAPTTFLALPALAYAAARWISKASRASDLPLHQVLLFCLLLVMLGLDLGAFSEHVTALHLPVESISGGDASAWQRIAFVLTSAALSLVLLVSLRQRQRAYLPYTVTGICLIFGAFISHSWMPARSKNLSHSHLVRRYIDLREDGQPILSLGKAPRVLRLYAPSAKEKQRGDLINALGRESRVFAFVPKNSYCSLRQDIRRKSIEPIVLEQNSAFVLLSNQHKEGEPRNQELDLLLHKYSPRERESTLEPTIFGDSLRLLSVDMPSRVERGTEFDLRLRYEVLKRPRRTWKIFAHFDGPGMRFQGDHDPIDGKCASIYWNPGDIVVDTVTVKAGGITHVTGRYRLWTGFFYGSHGNWTRMPVTRGGHEDDRVLVGTLEVH